MLDTNKYNEAEFINKAWSNMHAKLEKEMPVRKRNYLVLLWFVLLSIAGLWAYTLVDHRAEKDHVLPIENIPHEPRAYQVPADLPVPTNERQTETIESSMANARVLSSQKLMLTKSNEIPIHQVKSSIPVSSDLYLSDESMEGDNSQVEINQNISPVDKVSVSHLDKRLFDLPIELVDPSRSDDGSIVYSIPFVQPISGMSKSSSRNKIDISVAGSASFLSFDSPISGSIGVMVEKKVSNSVGAVASVQANYRSYNVSPGTDLTNMDIDDNIIEHSYFKSAKVAAGLVVDISSKMFISGTLGYNWIGSTSASTEQVASLDLSNMANPSLDIASSYTSNSAWSVGLVAGHRLTDRLSITLGLEKYLDNPVSNHTDKSLYGSIGVQVLLN